MITKLINNNSVCLQEHGQLLEKQGDQEPLLKALHYLLLISEVKFIF